MKDFSEEGNVCIKQLRRQEIVRHERDVVRFGLAFGDSQLVLNDVIKMWEMFSDAERDMAFASSEINDC